MLLYLDFGGYFFFAFLYKFFNYFIDFQSEIFIGIVIEIAINLYTNLRRNNISKILSFPIYHYTISLGNVLTDFNVNNLHIFCYIYPCFIVFDDITNSILFHILIINFWYIVIKLIYKSLLHNVEFIYQFQQIFENSLGFFLPIKRVLLLPF